MVVEKKAEEKMAEGKNGQCKKAEEKTKNKKI